MKTKLTVIATSIFFLFLISKNITAQNKKLNFELEFTPKVGFRVDIGSNTFNKSTKPLVLFDAGVNIKYPISEKNTIGSGVLYSVKGYKLKINSGDFNIDIPDNFTANFTYNYAEIPVFFEHSFNKIIIKTGLIYQRLLFAKQKYNNVPDSVYGISKDEFINSIDKTTSSSELKAGNYNMNNIGFMLSIGKYYDLNEKMYWGWGLQFKTSLLPMAKSTLTGFDVYYYSAGINLKIGLK